jgi:hypothetical protein
MACPRLLRGVLLLLCPGLACQANTIELETMAGSGATGDDDTGLATDDATGSASVTVSGSASASASATVTASASASATITATGSTGDSADGTAGPVLDVSIDPGQAQTLLLAIDTNLSPGLPFQGIVWLQSSATAVDLELQWLSLDQGSTTLPRELVGDVYSYLGIPMDPEGGFTWSTGVILVPGAANPITGSDVVLSAVVEVVPMGSPYCGRVSGEVTSPIQAPLDGSTHAMTTVASELELPLEFPVSCPP